MNPSAHSARRSRPSAPARAPRVRGLGIQQRTAAVGGTDSRLSHREFDTIVNRRLQDCGHDDARERDELVRDILKAATHRLVLLVGNTENEIGFEIRSFQEFVAAEHLFDGGESCVVKTLDAMVPDPYWQNVFLFVAGRIFFERQMLIAVLIALCAKLNDPPNDVAHVAIHAGSRLALAMLTEGVARNQPGPLRVLARCAARALDTWDCEVGDRFATLFSGDVEKIWKEELSQRLTSSAVRFPRQAWYICLQLVRSGNSWALKLMDDYFPWTSEDAHRFFIELPRNSIPDTFVERFFRYAWRHLPDFYLRIADDYFGVLPIQARSLVRLSNYSGTDYPVLDQSGQDTGINLHVQWIEDDVSALHFSKDVLTNAHPAWLIIDAFCHFAREPNEGSLVNQLKVIAEIDLDSVKSTSVVPPWQLGVCLAAWKEGHSWEEIISRVSQGALGNADDWKRWHENVKMGIKISQCRRDSEWLAVSNEALGLLVQSAQASYTIGSTRALHFVDELSDALTQWPKNKNTLVDTACWVLAKHVSSLSADSIASLVRFLDSCRNSTTGIDATLLPALILCPAPVTEGLGMLAKAGMCSLTRTNPYYFVGDWSDWSKLAVAVEIRLSALLAELPSSSNWQEVLRAISYLPPLEALQSIPDVLLNKSCFKEERLAKAAVVIRLNSLSWVPADVPVMAREALALRTDYPWHLNDLFRFIDEKGKHGLHLELFLSELLKEAPQDVEVRWLDHITTLLVKLVDRRPTNVSLPDPADCIRRRG